MAGVYTLGLQNGTKYVLERREGREGEEARR